jgi:CCT motif
MLPFLVLLSVTSRRLPLRFMEKRKKRVWQRKVKYDVRKSFADSRLRVKGRFVKKEDEELLRDLMHML